MLFKVYRTTVAIVLALGTVWAGWFFYNKFADDSVATPAPPAHTEARPPPTDPVMPHAAITVAEWQALPPHIRAGLVGDWLFASIDMGLAKSMPESESVAFMTAIEKCMAGAAQREAKVIYQKAADTAGMCIVAMQTLQKQSHPADR